MGGGGKGPDATVCTYVLEAVEAITAVLPQRAGMLQHLLQGCNLEGHLVLLLGAILLRSRGVGGLRDGASFCQRNRVGSLGEAKGTGFGSIIPCRHS